MTRNEKRSGAYLQVCSVNLSKKKNEKNGKTQENQKRFFPDQLVTPH